MEYINKLQQIIKRVTTTEAKDVTPLVDITTPVAATDTACAMAQSVNRSASTTKMMLYFTTI